MNGELVLHRAMQDVNRRTMRLLREQIHAGMRLLDVRALAEKTMLENGADSFWYYGVGAFVFAGDETTVSVSGRQYATSDRIIQPDDIVTVDLSPQKDGRWGDYARTIILQGGRAVHNTEEVQEPEWKRGLQMEERLHEALFEMATPELEFEELYTRMNAVIAQAGFVNLDFAGNLGHSIVREKRDRIYIEKGNRAKLSDAVMFTFEPHIGMPESVYGYKREDIYYFEGRQLKRL